MCVMVGDLSVRIFEFAAIDPSKEQWCQRAQPTVFHRFPRSRSPQQRVGPLTTHLQRKLKRKSPTQVGFDLRFVERQLRDTWAIALQLNARLTCDSVTRFGRLCIVLNLRNYSFGADSGQSEARLR